MSNTYCKANDYRELTLADIFKERSDGKAIIRLVELLLDKGLISVDDALEIADDSENYYLFEGSEYE